MILGDPAEDSVGVGGPSERFGVGVAFVEVGQRGFPMRLDALEHAAAELLFGQIGEDLFDLVDPTGARRCEVQMIPGTLGQPIV